MRHVVSKRRSEERTDVGALWPQAADRSSGMRPRPASLSDADDSLDGHYRLLGPLGESAYGRAFRAQQLPLGREVAVHFIPEGLVAERVLSRELPLAVAKCAQLVHPNVVGLHAYGRADDTRGLYYVVTDPLEGVVLSEYLRARGRLSPKQALVLLRQVGRALRAAHKLDIFHGDLRPANIRVVEIDDRPVLKVVGFGKLPWLTGGSELSTHVRGISVPNYAAPELLRGEPVDARSDVYALGAILFRMIAGIAPFSGATPGAVLEAMRNPLRPSLRKLVGEAVPVEVDALVARALHTDPQQRFADVVAMMGAMRFLLLDEAELLSREVSEVTSSYLPGSANSILPSVSDPADATGARQAILVHEGGKARTRAFMIAVGIVLVLAIGWEIWLSAEIEGAKSEPAQATPSQVDPSP